MGVSMGRRIQHCIRLGKWCGRGHTHHCSVVKQPELVPREERVTVEFLHGPALEVGMSYTVLVQAVHERVITGLGRRDTGMCIRSVRA